MKDFINPVGAEVEATPEQPMNETPVSDDVMPETEESESGSEKVEVASSPIEEDTDEWEHAGKKYRIPKELKPALLRSADYAQKVEEIRQQRAQIEQERTAHQTASQEYLRDLGHIYALDSQISQYDGVDWNTLTVQDPARAQQAFIALSQMKEMRQRLATKALEAEQSRTRAQQEAIAQQRAKAVEVLHREIPEWTPDVDKAVSRFAVEELKLRPEEVARIGDPRVVKALYRHMKAEAEVKALRAELAKLKKPQPEAKVSGAGGGNTRALDDPSLSMKEWLSIRKKQIAARH